MAIVWLTGVAQPVIVLNSIAQLPGFRPLNTKPLVRQVDVPIGLHLALAFRAWEGSIVTFNDPVVNV
jgi:hypothetical protein